MVNFNVCQKDYLACTSVIPQLHNEQLKKRLKVEQVQMRGRMYVGAGTNWSPVTGVVFGEFLVSDVATPCILYLILYGQNNSTVATYKNL